jgi:predicted TIM-barrel fold metal-dependent hydrolase
VVIVDTHTHVVAPDADRYPLHALDAEGGWYRDAAVSVDGLVELMDEARVDRAVLVQGVSAYRHDNRYVLDSAARFRARCSSVVCLDPQAPDAIATLRRQAVDEGARGLRWWALADEPLAEPRAMWDELAGLGLPVVVTMFARRIDELLRVVPGLPEVQIAVDHCAFADFAHGMPDDLRALSTVPTISLKVSTIVLDALAAHGDARDGLAELAACFGAERLMWGSDFSQTHDRPYPDLVEHARVASSRLGDDARAAFLGGTALRLWPELA